MASDARTAPAAAGPSFTAASDGDMPDAELSTAESIVAGGKVAAAGQKLDGGKADDRAVVDAGHSLKGRADGASALSPAADSAAAEPTTPRVRFSLANLILDDDSSSTDAEDGHAAATAQSVAEAASTDTDGAAASQKVPRQSAWSRLRAKAATNDSEDGGSNEAAVYPRSVVSPSVPTTRSSLKSPKTGNTGIAVSSNTQHDSVPEAASPSAAAAAHDKEAASSAALPQAATPSAGAAVDEPSGQPQPLFISSVKPRSSIQRMLHRVLQ